MTEPGNGRSEGRGQSGAPKKPEKTFPFFPRSPEGALFISSGLTVFSFLSHIFFLLLVDPWRVLSISKESAMAYSTIPLCFGVIFLLSTIYSFIKIEYRSIFHIIIFIFALIFGSFSLHGLFGLVHHYFNLAVLSSYPR